VYREGRRRRITLLLPALLFLAACGGTPLPDVVLVTLDTTRADRVGAMGDRTARTPVLDALAARGVVFERAFASAPLTLPSHATILSGLDPEHHGVHDNRRFVLPHDVDTVAERLAARGYATAAFVAAAVLDKAFGLGRGFQLYDDDVESAPDPLAFTVPRRNGAQVAERAVAWLRRREPRRPFFLWVHFYDVHLPRNAPAPFDVSGDSYADAIAYVDAQLGRVLAAVDEAAHGWPTLVVAVADHGEGLGDHDEESHGMVAYDSTLHVPLIVAGPGFPAGTRSRTLARTADVAPTILLAAGAPTLAAADGRPLQGRLAEPAPEGDGDVAYFETFGAEALFAWAPVGGVRTARWKYTAEPEPPELYDVLADPAETTNRVAEEPSVVERLAARYGVLRAARERVTTSGLPRSLDLQAKLAALGYAAPAGARALGERGPDPRLVVGAAAWIDGARSLASDGRVAGSIEALEILRGSPVARISALWSLAIVYLEADRPADAVGVASELATATGSAEATALLAECLLADGRATEALQTLDRLGDGQDAPERVLLLRGRALLAAGRSGEAARVGAALVEREPNSDLALAFESRARAAREGRTTAIERLRKFLDARPDREHYDESRLVLATLLHEEGRDADAVKTLDEAWPMPATYRMLEAEIAAAHGDMPKAAAQFEAVLAERPGALTARRALAETYASLGRVDDALALYAEVIAARPRDASLLVDRGAMLLSADRRVEAEADFTEALTIDDGLPEAHLNLALVELGDGRDAAAESQLIRAVTLRPNYAKAHFHLARLYQRRGDPRAAKEASLAVETTSEAPAVGTSSTMHIEGVR
jgi:arylsulfatase A-like enzyme/tetratricopeptide (TPR) repeat protein